MLCSNSLLHSPPNTTQPTSLCKQHSHPLHNFQSQISQHSLQKGVEAVDVEASDVAVVQIIQPRAYATYAPHSPILSDAANMAACPPLVENANTVAAWHRSCNKTCSAIWHQCTPTSPNIMQIRMCVFLAVLMSKMDIHPKHALPPGDVLITRRDLIGIIQGSTLQRGTTRAPKQCTRVSCPLCDGVG
jgi:hypothetical protein